MTRDAPKPLRLEPSPRESPTRPPRDSLATTKYWIAGDSEKLAAGVRLLDAVIRAISPGLLKVRPKSATQTVLAGLSTTALRRARVVHQLLASADSAWLCNQEAAILTRTILDLAISAIFIASAPGVQRDQLAARFLAFEYHQVDRLTGRKGPSARGSPRERIHRAFKDLDEGSYRGWSGLSNAKMIEKIRDEPARALARDLQYEFSILSFFVHPSPAGTRRSVEGPSLADELLDVSVPFCAAMAVRAASSSTWRVAPPRRGRESDSGVAPVAAAFDEYAAAVGLDVETAT